jgi:2',3'-cyclic-nucleotide 2'-phosphodiesterase (5'-nucleotidase family)
MDAIPLSSSPNSFPRPEPGQIVLLPSKFQTQADPRRKVYLLAGDAAAGPVREIISVGGVDLSQEARARHDSLYRLKVLHINDLHGQINHITPLGSQPIFSRLVWQLRQLRQQYTDDPQQGLLFLSAGDDMTG